MSLILSAALGFTAPAEGVYTPGTYTATASGMGELSVSVTVDDSSIVDIVIDGANETPEIGGAALETLAEQVKESQGAGIEGVSGASITSDAVRVAVEKALAEASGSSSSEKAAVADGTYQAKAPSFGVMKEMELAVTFENNEITGIETICAGSATMRSPGSRPSAQVLPLRPTKMSTARSTLQWRNISIRELSRRRALP